ncbi:MAG: hypothetical protein J7L56_03325 [Halomonas sp.]|nr:hypothetical protein [Halomonas sp.]MCD6437282.1 hypothetical protein [Halomonas sp.]
MSYDITPEDTGGHYGIMLPCAPEDFGEFVSGLLGKPQTIEKGFSGFFDLSRTDVVNTFHLVDQRIRQQNEASLVQFTVRIIYEDNSSVLLSSLDELSHYSEVKPLVSTGIVLSWSYLIKFRNKKVPEKQDIDLSFISDMRRRRGIVIGIEEFSELGMPGIMLRVKHTDRTWGVDIESLLSGHVESLLRAESRKARFVRRHSGRISLLVGSFFFLSAIGGAFWASLRFVRSQTENLQAVRSATKGSPQYFQTQIDLLLDILVSGVWTRFTFATLGFLVLALVASIFLAVWVESSANKAPFSFVTLSRKAEERRDNLLGQQKRDWLIFCASIFTSIAAGVVSNLLFVRFFAVTG